MSKWNEAIERLHRVIDIQDLTERRMIFTKWINTHVHQCETISYIDDDVAQKSRIDLKKMEKERRYAMIGKLLHDTEGAATETERADYHGMKYTTTLLVLK